MSRTAADATELLSQLNSAKSEIMRFVALKFAPLEETLLNIISGVSLPVKQEEEIMNSHTTAVGQKRVLSEIEANIIPVEVKRIKKEGKPDTNLHFDEEGFVVVHTDGACSANGRAGARAGVGIWWYDNSHHNVSRPVTGSRHTNNTAEIQAAYVAVKQARDMNIKKLNIKTDSKFVIDCMNVWIHGWKKNNWRKKSKEPVINREDLERLDAEINSGDVQVKWTHVRGHAGIYGNEQADRLATDGAKLK